MAEFVLKDMVEKLGIAYQFHIESAATSTEEIGNPVHPGTRNKLREYGISCVGKYARQMTPQDYREYDYLIGMDSYNIRNIYRIAGMADIWKSFKEPVDKKKKTFLLLEFAGQSDSIADPWYTHNFDDTYRDVEKGCKAFLNYLQKKGEIKV